LAPFALAASVLLTAGIAWRAQHDAAAVPALAVSTPATAPTPTQAPTQTATAVPATPGAAARGGVQGALAGDADRSRMITGTVVARESKAVSDEYQAALRQFDGAPLPAEVAPTLHALDRSVAQIRRAIAADPGSVFLLEQLRRTYELRLSLTQRAVLG
jgi:hypothetical protein